jgi:hypothetical protein
MELILSASARSDRRSSPRRELCRPEDRIAHPRSGTAIVDVEDIYKSAGPEPISATVEFEEGQLRKGEKGIFFLKSTAPSVYALADPFIGVTPFSSIPIPQQTAVPGLSKLEATLAVVAERPQLDDQINAMKLLQGFDSLTAATISKLIPLSTSKDFKIALSALAVLLKSKKPEDVERVWKLRTTNRIPNPSRF